MRRLRVSLARLLVLAFVVTGTVSAQAPASDTISKALVERLLRGLGTPGGVITEGAPQDFPAELLPEGATARISLHSSQMTTVVGEAPGFLVTSRARFERQLAAAGWAVGSHGGPGGHGLTASREFAATFFCRDGRYATYSVSPRRDGGSWVNVSLTAYDRVSPCDQGRDERAYRSVFDELAVPPLEPPLDSDVEGMSSGGGSNSESQELRLATAMNARDVASHYIERLLAGGWLLGSRVDAEGFSVVRFALPAQPEVTPLLMTMAAPRGKVDVVLRLGIPDGYRR